MAASNTRRVALGTLNQGIGKVVGIACGVLAFAITSRVLGPERYGALATAVTFASVFATFADLGLPVLLLRLLALHKRDNEVRIANLHTLRLISTVVVMLLGVGVARLFPYSPEIQRSILIISLGFIAVSYTQYIVSVFQERLRTGRAAVAEVLGRATMLGLTAAAAYFGWSTVAFAWATTLGSAVAFVLTYVLSLHLWRLRLGWKPAAWPELVRLATPLVLLTMFQIIYFKVDTLLLSLISGDHAVGLYAAAYKFMDVFITFPALFSALVLPFVARTTDRPDELRRIFGKALRAVIVVAVPLATITAIEGPRLVSLLSGSAFAESGAVLQLLSLAVLPLFIGNLSTTAMIGLGRAPAVAWIFAGAALGGVVVYLVGINLAGYWGAAAGTVLIESAVAVASLTYTLRRIGRIDSPRLLRTALAAGGYAGVALLVRSLPLLPALALGGVAYLALLFATGTLSWAEARALTARTYRV